MENLKILHSLFNLFKEMKINEYNNNIKSIHSKLIE